MINDAHKPLADLWTSIVQDAEGLAESYGALWHAQLAAPRSYYDAVRREFNQRHEPGHFLYLLARCVKAAIRYNRTGEFNNSPDNRRLGMRPATMRQNLLLVAEVLRQRTTISANDYTVTLAEAARQDVVYMDPPYQGVCMQRDNRYVRGVPYDEFVSALSLLNARGISYVVSYDGRTGDKTYGRALPAHLRLHHAEVAAGRSTQATLLGRSHETCESLYLSPALLGRLGGVPRRLREQEEPLLSAEG